MMHFRDANKLPDDHLYSALIVFLVINQIRPYPEPDIVLNALLDTRLEQPLKAPKH
jgi:hypothetical protein